MRWPPAWRPRTGEAGTASRSVVLEPSPEALHEWRKGAKHLWHQTQLLAPSAPSALAPAEVSLHALADTLGDDHDLVELVDLLRADPDTFGGSEEVEAAVDLADRRRADLEGRALALGVRLYAEKPKAFVDRMARYWDTWQTYGDELPAGEIGTIAPPDDGLDDLTRSRALRPRPGCRHRRPLRDGPRRPHRQPPGRSPVMERERKFLVDRLPDDLGPAVAIRQGYLALDGNVQVRVRRADRACTLTVKGGRGRDRTEVETTITVEQFDDLWPLTDGRRIEKARHRVPLVDGRTAEVDLYAAAHAGLQVVEVEFPENADPDAFVPPPWFGRDVTDDARYSNADLATAGESPH